MLCYNCRLMNVLSQRVCVRDWSPMVCFSAEAYSSSGGTIHQHGETLFRLHKRYAHQHGVSRHTETRQHLLLYQSQDRTTSLRGYLCVSLDSPPLIGAFFLTACRGRHACKPCPSFHRSRRFPPSLHSSRVDVTFGRVQRNVLTPFSGEAGSALSDGLLD